MTEIEAGEFVQRLFHAYPGVKFTEQNARSYRSLLQTLGAEEAEAARVELVETSKFLPSFAEIRDAVMRNRKVTSDKQAVARLPSGQGFPSPHDWGRKLDGMLTDAERYEKMARAWYAAKGKKYPGDPAAGIIETVKAGARGEDIRDRLKAAVGDQDEQERRHP